MSESGNPKAGRKRSRKERLLRVLYGLGFRAPLVRGPLLLRIFSTPFRAAADPAPLPREAREQWLEAASRFRTVRIGQGPRVFFVHGWGGNLGQMLTMAKAAARLGKEAILLDLPAHGSSPGKRTNGFEAGRAIERLTKEYGHPEAIVAHSFGALATGIAVGLGVRPERLVLIAPLPSLAWAARDFALKVKVSPHSMAKVARSFAQRLGLEPAKLDLGAEGPHRALPTLIIHDRGDRIIPAQESERLVEDWPAASLIVTEGLAHTRILEDAYVLERVIAFISSAATPQRLAGGSQL